MVYKYFVKSFQKLLAGSAILLFAPPCIGSVLDISGLPFSYCSEDVCRTVRTPLRFFFGILPEEVFSTCQDQDAYALTFDDGPSANWPQILDILSKHQVKATFFVLGNKLSDAENKTLLKEAHSQGHQISNHSFSHPNFLETPIDKILIELGRTTKAISDGLEYDARAKRDSNIVRPPFGYINQEIMNELAKEGYSVVRWNGDRYDWHLGADQGALIIQRLKEQLDYVKVHAAEGIHTSILDLNHDFSQATLKSLDELIQRVSGAGYRFVTVHECITGIPDNP